MVLAKNDVKKPRCVFYPKLVCSVRAEMQKETVIADLIKPDMKKLPDEAQFVVKITDAIKSVYEMKWMYLSHFCSLCEKKRLQDVKCCSQQIKNQMMVPLGIIVCPKCGKKCLNLAQPL